VRRPNALDLNCFAQPGGRTNDWGVCGNPRSHRAALLTFEHQGCRLNERNRSFNNYFRLPVIEK
jgi:hypothetical protein